MEEASKKGFSSKQFSVREVMTFWGVMAVTMSGASWQTWEPMILRPLASSRGKDCPE